MIKRRVEEKGKTRPHSSRDPIHPVLVRPKGYQATAVAMKEGTVYTKEDWQNAMLWANQWWQYQVKTADLGLRAKIYLEESGATEVK